ncbi:nucleotidyltransferase domain-containing protein [Sulfurimonas sediminis]|uniref:Nucleotidyltransferase domain-containing protein n=1 Tax=Sulfurimonas sediminis TaxID=2590020 RepID=A0A7M1B3I7_9BACT|nr:nucleotidyltransferase domain-containing protein [Sulfurimonas sediminis]QOP44291.1 nucleotidyltransferase domain-containing protein [Sulfurimonas sediminis]
MLIEQIKNILQKYEVIENALLFGSYANNQQHKMSDIDIAVQTTKELDLFEMGEIISDLETQLNNKIDFIILNELYKNSPLLAYNIYLNHIPVFIHNHKKYNIFKENSMHYYFDFKHIIDEQNETFKQRILDGNIAKTQTA